MMEPCIDHGRHGFGPGYATAYYKGRTTTLHRKIFIEHTGTVPEVVEHICNNPRCINLAHLKAGTHKSNAAYKRACNRTGDVSRAGAANGRAKLSDSIVSYLRTMYIKGDREWEFPLLPNGCL